MYRFKSIKYLSATGIITGLLFVIGYTSSLFFTWAISALGGTTTLQLFDAIYIPFCAVFKGPMMLFAGAIAGGLVDLASGVRAISIPVTILIRVLMFLIIKLLTTKKWWSCTWSFLVAVLVIIVGYPLYYLAVYQDRAIVINELIADVIQGSFAYIVAIPLYYYLNRVQVKSNNHFWNDGEFDYLKPKKKNKSKDDGEKHGNK